MFYQTEALLRIFGAMGVIRKQGFLNILISYIGILLGFVNLVVVQPLLLEPQEVGMLRLLLAFSTLVSTFVPLGVGSIAIRYFPQIRQSPDHGFFWVLSGVMMVGFLFIGSILLMSSDFIKGQYAEESLLFAENYLFVLPLIFFLSFINGYTGLSFSHLKTVFPSLLNDVVVRILTILTVFLFAQGYFSFHTFLWAFIGIYGLQMVLLTFYLIIIMKPRLALKSTVYRKIGIRTLLSYGFILLFSAVASMGLKSVDSILIGRFVSLDSVAVYAIALFIGSVIEVPLNSVLKIVSPRISEEVSMDRWEKVGEIYSNSCYYLTIAGGFIYLMILLNVESVLSYLPDVYAEASGLVVLIGTGALINMVTGVNNTIIINSGDYRRGAAFLLGLFSLTVILDLLFIPYWGAYGAAVAGLIAVSVYNIANYIFLYLKRGFHPLPGKPLSVLALVGILVVVQFFIPHINHPLADILVRSVAGLLVFTFVLFFVIDPSLRQFRLSEFLNK